MAVTEHVTGTPFEGGPDEELNRVEAFFRSIEEFERRAGALIRQALDEVIDGARTGRWSIDQLEQPEKTYIGTKVEILLRAGFDLQPGDRLDCKVEGAEVDIKFTIHTNWTIPREAVDYICLLVRASDLRSVFSIGLVRATDEHLNPGLNRDQKRSVSALGRGRTRWLVLDGTLPENILLHLDGATRDRIFSHAGSGQRRVEELFRLVQGRIIPRQTVEIVARQRDPMRRGRQARMQLLPEGIVVICGTYEYQRQEAAILDLPIPRSDEWISTAAPEGWKPLTPAKSGE